MQKYQMEFILHAQDASAKTIKNSLSEFCDGLEVEDCPDMNTGKKDFKINLNTEDPTVIFDICAQFGRIRQIKVNEIKDSGITR